MSAGDLGSSDSGIGVDELESILVLTSEELILLPGNSLLVGLQVGIRCSLGSGGGGKVSIFSGRDEGLSSGIISDLEGSIEGSFLGVDGSTVGSFSGLELISVAVVRSSRSTGLGSKISSSSSIVTSMT